MPSVSVPADSPAGPLFSGLPQQRSNTPQEPVEDATRLVPDGTLALLPRRPAVVARPTDVSEDAVLRPPTPIRIQLLEADGVVHQSIAYQDLVRAATKLRGQSSESRINVFRAVLRTMRALPPEECESLLKAVGEWTWQPPAAMHANVDHALKECPQLPEDAQRKLLEVIVGWNLSDLPEEHQVDDYYRIVNAIFYLPDDEARKSLLGRLTDPIWRYNDDSQSRALEGIARAMMRKPLHQNASLQAGAA